MSTQETFAFDAGDVVNAPDVADDVLLPGASDADDVVVDITEPLVEIRASTRRRRTVTAYREGERTIVLVPARMSLKERERYAAELVERLAKREGRTRRTDDELMKRAGQLSRRWLGGRATPVAVRWVSNQNARWGSCTPLDGTIRLSDRLRGMPAYVIDAVLLHELAHLLHADHGPEFWALLAPFPDQERAKAYLEGAQYGQTHLRDS